MRTMTLTRVKYDIWGTFGILSDDDLLLTTIEREWKDNETDVSCIPLGEYACKRIVSPKFGQTYEVTGVTNRSNILFHKGNFAQSDSKGCILLGTGYGRINGQWAITDSGAGFSTFIKHLADAPEFSLILKNA